MNKSQFTIILVALAIITFLLAILLVRTSPNRPSLTYDFGDGVTGINIADKNPQTSNSQTNESDESVSGETMIATMYLVDKNSLESETSCSQVFPVNRIVVVTDSIEHSTMSAMLAGPTSEEIDLGFGTAIPVTATVRDININTATGISYVDFEGIDENSFESPCAVSAARAQILSTFRQFPDVLYPSIRLNGHTRNIFFPSS